MKVHLVAMAVSLSGFLSTVNAAAPQIKKQAPGYYRFMVGDIEVTTLLDGTFPLKPSEVLANAKPKEVARLLAEVHEGSSITTSVNGYLINTGEKLVLVDTGSGNFMGPTVGHLLENLKASGYTPAQVDEIYLTHMHSDHLGGLTTDGKINFPQAILRVNKREADFWLSDKESAQATQPMMKAMFANAKAMLAPYKSAGKLQTFDGELELVPGVRVHPAYGHTPGHTVYIVESKGKKLWLFGDMIHVAAVQFSNPKIAMAFDWNSHMAVAERIKDFSQATKAGDMIGGAHIAFPGVGHLRRRGTGYTFTPLTYGPVI